MPRNAGKPVRGTERYRDEQRAGGPRMHGRGWHDHDEPHELERADLNEGIDAVLEAESSGERTGMGTRSTGARPEQTSERRKRSVPPSKGKRTQSKRRRTRPKAAPKGPRRI
jgi:hypothetical protein